MFGSRSSKIGKGIAYPEQLRLPVSGPEKQADYRLTGVLVHAGASVNMGHYYSYVRAPNGLWCVPVCVRKASLCVGVHMSHVNTNG